MDCLRRGVPLVVENSALALQRRYNFAYFAEALKGQRIKTIHVLDGREEEKDAYDFFMGIAADDPETKQWKIKVTSFFVLIFLAGVLELVTNLVLSPNHPL